MELLLNPIAVSPMTQDAHPDFPQSDVSTDNLTREEWFGLIDQRLEWCKKANWFWWSEEEFAAYFEAKEAERETLGEKHIPHPYERVIEAFGRWVSEYPRFGEDYYRESDLDLTPNPPRLQERRLQLQNLIISKEFYWSKGIERPDYNGLFFAFLGKSGNFSAKDLADIENLNFFYWERSHWEVFFESYSLDLAVLGKDFTPRNPYDRVVCEFGWWICQQAVFPTADQRVAFLKLLEDLACEYWFSGEDIPPEILHHYNLGSGRGVREWVNCRR